MQANAPQQGFFVLFRIALISLLSLSASTIVALADSDSLPNPDPLADVSPAEARAIEKRFAVTLIAHIEKFKRYPPDALGVDGLVRVSFVLDTKGQLHHPKIETSSCFAILDRAATDLLEQAKPFPPLPAALGKDKVFHLPVIYRNPKRRGPPVPPNAGCKPPIEERTRLEHDDLEKKLGLRPGP